MKALTVKSALIENTDSPLIHGILSMMPTMTGTGTIIRTLITG